MNRQIEPTMGPNHQTRDFRRRLAPALLSLLVIGVAALATGGGQATAALGDPLAPPPPNIVLIMTDDQPASTVTPASMPNLHDLVVGPGSSFTDYVVTTPLCCPSRATTITGQYGHNNGVLRNDYADLVGKSNVLPVWLQRAGYTTAHLGKFLNGFGSFVGGQKRVAPGWDLWFTQFENKKYYNWKASKNGQTVAFGERDTDHLTQVTNRRAAAWAGKLAAGPDPFYLQLDYYAPHGASGRDRTCIMGPVPAPRDEQAFADAPLPRPPNYNEEDVSDKPALIRNRPLIGTATEEGIRRRYRCTMAAVLSVDRGIASVASKIEDQGELDRTVFIFTSDNGYFFGEHRITRAKDQPYDENLRMPLSIRIPAAYRDQVPQPSLIDAPAANIDLAPTILDLAGADPCRREGRCRIMDGRSLMPLVDGGGGWPNDRAILVELGDCLYTGVRTDGQIYFEYGDGPLETTGECRPTEAEHYDLDDDPFELDNLYPAPRRSPEGLLQRQLQQRVFDLGQCAGINGRDPLPESGAHCE